MGMVRKSANVVLVLFACAPVALAGLNDYGVMWSNQASYEPESGQGTHNRFSSQMGVLGTSGYVTTGWLSSNGTEPVWGVNIGLGSWHGAVTQFDKWGGTRWTDMTNVTDIVGASLDQTYLRGVAVRGDEVVIAGQSRWNMETGASGTGLFVRKYGGNGSITAPDNFDPDLDYAKSFNEGSAWGRSSHIATDGTVYTGGYATANVAGLTYNGSGSADRDAFLIKHNADGTVASGIYPNLSSEHDYAAAITTDASGNIYVMGGTYGSLSGFTNPNPNVSGSGGTADFFVVKYDSSWTQQWAKQWDGGGSGQDWLYSAGIDPNTGNLVAVGFTATSTNGNDAYIVAIDPSDGSTEWSDTFGTTGEEGASGISWDEDGNIWTGGDTSGNLAATVKGDADVFWRQYSNTGSVLNTIQLGTDAPEDGRGAAVDGDPQRLYISGGIQGV
ncbi:MAG: hypothetical protein MI741_00105, partial [Rhodospirillales bacterium]|nr:hypothetical protein [Rhodospirillales bacterium]